MTREEYEPRMVSLSAEEPAEETRGHRARADEFELRPRNSPQLVDLGIEVLARRFLLCVGGSVLLWLPVRAAMPFLLRMMPGPVAGGERMLAFWAALGGYTVVAKFLETIVTMSVTLISYQALIGRHLRPAEALSRTLRRTLALLGLFALQFLILSVGGGLVLVLGAMCFPLLAGALAYYLYFSWKLSVAPGVLMLEDAGVTESISRSFRLTEGSFLRWLGLIAISALLTAGLGGGMQLSDNQLIRQAILDATSVSPVLYDVVFVFISSVFAGLMTAIVAVTTTTYYLDLRIRREGLDLRMRLERLSRAGAAEFAT